MAIAASSGGPSGARLGVLAVAAVAATVAFSQSAGSLAATGSGSAGVGRRASATGPTGPRGGPTGSTGLSGGPTGSTGPRGAPAPTRYRLVGCRSHDDVAYLHGPHRREVAIGFDDGPAPDTAAFVAMLEHNGVRATFFMIGEQVTPSYRETLLRELRDGDVLGDHTFTHPFLTSSPMCAVSSRRRSGRSTS